MTTIEIRTVINDPMCQRIISTHRQFAAALVHGIIKYEEKFGVMPTKEQIRSSIDLSY